MKKKYIAMALAATLFNVNVALAKEVKKDTNKSKVIVEEKDLLLATVNGKKIMKSYFSKDYDTLTLDWKKKRLDRVISSELLVQYAEKQPLFKDEKLIKEVNKYAEKTKKEGGKFTDLDYRMVLGLHVIQALADEYALKQASDDDIHRYYIKRRQNFKGMPYIDAYTIKTSTKEKAEEIIKELTSNKSKNKKAFFLKLMKKYKVEDIGKLGRIYKFGIDNNVYYRALFSLKTNQFSSIPVEVDNSFYVMYVELKSTASKPPLEQELKSNIVQILQHKARNEWVNFKLKELKKEAKIVKKLK